MEITKKEYLKALETIEAYVAQLDRNQAMQDPNGLIPVTELSTRLRNVLYNNSDRLGINRPTWPDPYTFLDFKRISLRRLFECHLSGKKTVQEFKDLCRRYGIEPLP